MISVELWRARIGTFNNKRCSGCSLSSSLLSSHCRRQTHHGGGSTDASREEPSSVALTSPSSNTLATKEQSQEFSSIDYHSKSIFSSTSASQPRSQLALCCSYGSSFSSTSKSSSYSSPSPCDLCHSLLREAVITLLIAIISQLLMIAGDIETNPGPKHGADDTPGLDDLLCMSYTGGDGRDTRFRLMDQLRPHWRRLAAALKFNHNDIAIMEHKDDPVFYLLSEWLRGANQERDSRPVTWGTLITALRDANVQKEADILEEHFVEKRLPVVPVAMSQAEESQEPGTYFELFHDPSGGYIMRHGPIQVLIKPNVPEKLRSLMKEYASMLEILRRSELSETSFSGLKSFLSIYCGLESIEQCTSLRAVIDLLIKLLNVYMFDINTLNNSCEYFNNTIKLTVKKYSKCLDDFFKNTSVKKLINTIKTQIIDKIGMEPITLKLDENRVDITLKALNTLLYHLFGNCSRALKLCEIGSGCVCITWLVSASLVSTLRVKIEHYTQESLASRGVLEVVIAGLRIAPVEGQVSTITGGTPSTDVLEHEWSKEMLSFKKHCLELSRHIQYPTLLYCRLQSAGLLPRDGSMKISDIASTKLGVSELLDAVEEMINLNSGNFYKFVEVLEKDSTMWTICNKLQWSTALQISGCYITIPPFSFYSSTSFKFSSPLSSFLSQSSIAAVAMKQYRAYLKDCYRQPFPDDYKLLTTATKHYIELAVIRRKKKYMNYPGLTRIFASAEPPTILQEILKSECKPGQRVLIEGVPGIGKSTLAWEVCHKWEDLDSVKQYELVVLVRLRDKKAQEARCLEDLLPCDATTNMKELVAAIGRGKGLLIVCDGFDELPDEQRTDSVYIDLLKGRLLPEAAVIVTSRPSVSASFLSLEHKIGTLLEVIGFITKEDIKQFAESVFSGDILEGFLSYITSNPPIYSMMYVPLNAVIVALTYQYSYDTDTPFSTTMTQLFDVLTRALIRRHCYLSQNIHMPPSLQHMKEIDKLPPLVAQQMVELVDLAYNGMLQKTDIFELSEDFEHFGMMKKTTSLDVRTGSKSSYAFLHFTFQKYMAALHCAFYQTTSSELWSHRIPDLDQNDVIRFVAGICSHSEYRDQPLYHDLVRIISITFYTSQHSLLLVQCAYECPSIMQDVKMGYSSDDVVLVEPVVGFDWYATGYCISHFDLKWGLSIHEVIEENAIDLLEQGIRSSPVAIGSIQEMKILDTGLSISQIFNKLKEFCQLQSLKLAISSNPTKEDALVMRQLIQSGSNLRSLVFWCSPTLTSILLAQSSLEELLVKFLPNYTSLTCLIINEKVYTHGLHVLFELIQSHPTLEVVEIGPL